VSARRFVFLHDPRFAGLLRVAGVTPATAWVEVDEEELRVRFGRLSLRTSRANIAGVEVSGPYRWYRAIGPRLSLADHGVTFGTATHGGACVRFHEPVPALLGPRFGHPGVTVTVADPAGLAASLSRRAGDGGATQ
jgi:hypothetical protein